MAQIISIHSWRGGTGKSNITANLAVLLAQAGKRVAVVDTDIQSPGMHILFGVQGATVRYLLNDFLWMRRSLHPSAQLVTATERLPT